METSNHSINILTFDHPVKEKVFGFKFEKEEGYYPLRKGEYPKELWQEFEKELENTDCIYCDFSTLDGCDLKIEVDLSYSAYFARHYYHYIIAQYFNEIANVVHSNFINSIELWFKNTAKSNSTFNVYEKFTISVRLESVSNSPELLVAYNGCSKVFIDNAFDLLNRGVNSDHFKKFVYNNHLVKYDKDKFDFEILQECYPLLNRDIADDLELPEAEVVINKFKYKNYYEMINAFFKKYLCTDEFLSIIPHTQEWHQLTTISRIANEASILQFAKGEHTDPYEGFKTYQPFKSAKLGDYRFFFICHNDDMELARNFHRYSKRELGFIDFRSFLNLPIQYEECLHVFYDDDTSPVEATKEKFKDLKLEANVNYLAIYISPFHKSETNPENKELYYKVKKLLVDNKISSQVIYRENLNKKDFKFYVSNIAVAILAKLGGIPWCLKDKSNDELIVGVGAFKSKQFNQRYLGSTFCFSSDGSFNGFSCLPADNPRLLAGSIKEAILNYKKTNSEAKRLVIHFYKQMRENEIRPIVQKIKELGDNIPVIIVSVNKTESGDYVFFDDNFKSKMPYSGSYIHIGRNNYILCNNTRYVPKMSLEAGDTPAAITEELESLKKQLKSYPLPVKLHLQSTDETIIKNPAEVQKLIEQVYQFSRLYWKSVSHQSIPVTVKYPEMLAEIYPHFQSSGLSGFATQNLWFL